MIAARQVAFGRGGKRWKNPYITDGLFAMWDGEWNVGGGEHDPDATVCKNLISDHDIKGTVYSENLFTAHDSAVDNLWESASISVFNGNFTFEWVMSPLVEGLGQVLYTRKDNNLVENRRYSVNGVRKGYQYWQIGYFKDGEQKLVYPMIKSGNNYCAIMFDEWKFKVFANGSLVSSYDADASTDVNGAILCTQLTFHDIRLYNRALTAEEIAHNYEIDKERFGL